MAIKKIKVGNTEHELIPTGTINLTGDVTGSGTFNNSGSLSIDTTVKDNSHKHAISDVNGLQGVLDATDAWLAENVKEYAFAKDGMSVYLSSSGVSTAAAAPSGGGNVSSIMINDELYNFEPAEHAHNAGEITSGTLDVARGGTGRSTHDSNAVLTGNGTNRVNNVSTGNGAFYATSAGGVAKFGTLPVAQGGTGLTSNPSMLVNLGSTSAASVLAASPRPGITGTLPITNGGTGATTAAGALTNLGLTATAAELNTLDGITASVTELNYCDGVTSNIQTQLDSKFNKSGGTVTGATTFNSTVKIGNATLSYDTTEDALVISFN